MADPFFKYLAFAALAQTARNPTGEFNRSVLGAQQLQRPAEPYLRQQYPEVYGGLGGFMGMAPDEMGGSVLDPNTARVRAGAQIGFPIGTATQVVPALNMIRPAVKAGARALGPTAVSMGEGYLQRQGLMPQLDVYHGSPYKFDRFDASKIGTGEGAQAYGYGIYTAESPKVAKSYQQTEGMYKRVTGGMTNKEEFIADHLSQGRPEMSILDLYAQKYGGSFDDAMKDLVSVKQMYGGGSFYKVDLPDEQIAKMLDWDKPLSEQSDAVKAALKGIETKFPEIPDFNLRKWMDTDPLASTFHNVINRDLGVDPSLIANVFKKQGIPGIKYLDEGSRQPGVASMTQAQLDARINILKKDIDSGLGDQDRMKQILSSLEAERASHPKLTRNFVTFPGEEQTLTILERNNQPVQQAMNEFEQSLINFMATPAK